MKESNRIELKEKLTDHLEKEVVAFLNYREGGMIYIGISDSGETIGVNEVDQVQLMIKDRLKNNISPSCLGLFDIVHEVLEGKDIVKLNIASGTDKPYYLKSKGMSEKGCFIRVGTSAQPMTTAMIDSLYSSRTRYSLGKIKSDKQDLSFEQLKIYFNEAGKTLNERFASNLELLTENNEYNYAAYLLSDNNCISIKVAKYTGHDRVDLVESNEYGYSSIIKATKSVLDKLEIENRTITLITAKERREQDLNENI
ncbi:MAG: helix-turn-helix domain-containing protein [Bacteroidales bacterium]